MEIGFPINQGVHAPACSLYSTVDRQQICFLTADYPAGARLAQDIQKSCACALPNSMSFDADGRAAKLLIQCLQSFGLFLVGLTFHEVKGKGEAHPSHKEAQKSSSVHTPPGHPAAAHRSPRCTLGRSGPLVSPGSRPP